MCFLRAVQKQLSTYTEEILNVIELTTEVFNFEKECQGRIALPGIKMFYSANVIIFKNCTVWLINKLTDQMTRKSKRYEDIFNLTHDNNSIFVQWGEDNLFY